MSAPIACWRLAGWWEPSCFFSRPISHCVLEIGRLKKQEGPHLYQPDREREVLAAVERANRGPLSQAAIRRLFERILDEARSVERTVMQDEAGTDRHK